ncbi:MAG: DUF3145 domain-containing protein [Candidatus Nanopelagicales bacterium]
MTGVGGAPGREMTRGVLFVHSSPRALCPHLEWAVGEVLGIRVRLDWNTQPVMPTQVRAEFSWQAPTGTGARLASALRTFKAARYEVTEEPTRSTEGERFAATPELGVFRATMGAHGDVMIHEDRLRSVMTAAGSDPALLRRGLERILGTAWDTELEPLRRASDGVAVRWLHQVV